MPAPPLKFSKLLNLQIFDVRRVVSRTDSIVRDDDRPPESSRAGEGEEEGIFREQTELLDERHVGLFLDGEQVLLLYPIAMMASVRFHLITQLKFIRSVAINGIHPRICVNNVKAYVLFPLNT